MYPLNFRSQFVTFTPYSKSNFSKIYKNGYSESSKLKGIKGKIIKNKSNLCYGCMLCKFLAVKDRT